MINDATQKSPDLKTHDATQKPPDLKTHDATQKSPDLKTHDATQKSPDLKTHDATQKSTDLKTHDATQKPEDQEPNKRPPRKIILEFEGCLVIWFNAHTVLDLEGVSAGFSPLFGNSRP